MKGNWEQFYQVTKNNPPNRGLLKALSQLKHGNIALDLGCGAGRDTHYLLAQGFHVTAVDQEADSLELLAQLQADRLSLIQSTFEDFTFTHYDIINAHYALPFIRKEEFSTVFARLKASLNPNGIFVGQFFGIYDTWNNNMNHLTFLTREQAFNELTGLEIIQFEEEEQDGSTASGSIKHWHVYHIIARQQDGEK